MNIKGLENGISKLLLGVEGMIDSKEDALSNTENDTRMDKLQAQLDVLQSVLSLLEDAQFEISCWEKIGEDHESL